jgi:hypothetical protein
VAPRDGTEHISQGQQDQAERERRGHHAGRDAATVELEPEIQGRDPDPEEDQQPVPRSSAINLRVIVLSPRVTVGR